MAGPKIIRLQVHEYEYTLADMGTDYNGFNPVYEPGSTISRRGQKAPASSNPYFYQGDYSDALDAIGDRGHIPGPQGPGLGVEINRDWVERHRTGMAVYD